MRRGVFVCLLATACGDRPAVTPRPRETPPAEAASGPALLPYDQGAAEQPSRAATPRNPFRFARRRAAARAEDAGPPLPPADGLPELPLPLAQPPLRLLGVVTTDKGQRIAVISVGADLVLARSGEQVAGRFAVTAIGEESVELTDALVEATVIRLELP
jgi:hypothetical protein